jgi:hypothetical protein
MTDNAAKAAVFKDFTDRLKRETLWALGERFYTSKGRTLTPEEIDKLYPGKRKK